MSTEKELHRFLTGNNTIIWGIELAADWSGRRQDIKISSMSMTALHKNKLSHPPKIQEHSCCETQGHKPND